MERSSTSADTRGRHSHRQPPAPACDQRSDGACSALRARQRRPRLAAEQQGLGRALCRRAARPDRLHRPLHPSAGRAWRCGGAARQWPAPLLRRRRRRGSGGVAGAQLRDAAGGQRGRQLPARVHAPLGGCLSSCSPMLLCRARRSCAWLWDSRPAPLHSPRLCRAASPGRRRCLMWASPSRCHSWALQCTKRRRSAHSCTVPQFRGWWWHWPAGW